MMKNHSGNAEFDFEIERYLNTKTGDLYREDEIIDLDSSIDDFLILSKISLHVRGFSSFEPGRYYGPIEYCYPLDSEVEIYEVTDNKNNDWLKKLTKLEMEEIMNNIIRYSSNEEF